MQIDESRKTSNSDFQPKNKDTKNHRHHRDTAKSNSSADTETLISAE